VPVERPEADTENAVNLTGAQRAQDKLVIWMPTDPPQPMPSAHTSRIVVVVGMKGAEALAAMGLSTVEIDDAV